MTVKMSTNPQHDEDESDDGQPHLQQSGSVRRLLLSRAKLKQSSHVSALLSGFALVAMVEMDVETDIHGQPRVPSWLLIVFVVVTTLLVSVHMLALMISTCILPHLDAVVIRNNVDFSVDAPHEKMKRYTAIAWAFSTIFGIFLFLIELSLIIWVKFWTIDHHVMAIASGVILVPVMAAFLFFAFHFYRNLVAYKFENTERVISELEKIVETIKDGDLRKFSLSTASHNSLMIINNNKKNWITV